MNYSGADMQMTEMRDRLAAAHAREAALVKERDEARRVYTDDRGVSWLPPTAEAYQKTCVSLDVRMDQLREVEAERADLTRDNERLRAALEKARGALEQLETPGMLGEDESHALQEVGRIATEALAAPTPAVEQWRRERALRDAAVEYAESVLYPDRSKWGTGQRRHKAALDYRALRAQRTATPGSEGA